MGISQKEVSEREGQNHPYLFQPLFIEAVRSKTTSWIGQLTIIVRLILGHLSIQLSINKPHLIQCHTNLKP